MIIYLLRPTLSEGRKLHLVLHLGASIVPHIDVLLGITSIICLLMVCMPPRLGTCMGCVAVLHIKAAQETHVHVAVSFDDVGVHWGRVSCSRADFRDSRDKIWHDAHTHTTLMHRIVGEWSAWCSAYTWNDARARPPRPRPGLLAPCAFPPGWKDPMVGMLKCVRGGL